MRPAVLLVVACLAALAGLTYAAPVQYVTRSLPSPLLAWSGRSLLAGKHVYTSLSSASVMAVLDALSGKGTSPLVKGKEAPELILICGVQFSSDHLELAALHHQLPSVKRLVEESSSSVVAPYYFASPIVDQLNAYGVRHVADAVALKSLLEHETGLVSNGQVEVLYVSLDVEVLGPSAVDSALAQLTKLLAERTTNYVLVMLAPEAAMATHVYIDAAEIEGEGEMSRLARHALRQDTPVPTNTTTPPPSGAKYGTYFLPAINMAIISCVLLLIILTVALCATCTLQTPERFEGASVKKPVQRRQ